MFSGTSLKQRISMGIGLILLLLVVVAAVGWNALNTASNGFTTYRGLARDTNLAGRLQANMLMVRMNVKDFIITGSDLDLRQYAEYHDKMSTFMEEAQVEIQDPTRAKLVDEADEAVVDYDAGFDEVKGLAVQRNDIVLGTLNVKGPDMENNLTDIMISAEQDQDMTAAFRAGLSMKHLLLARVYMAKFLDANEQSAVDRVNEEFGKMQDQLNILDNELNNPTRRQLLSQVQKDKETYLSNFNDLADIIFTRNDIIQNTLDVLGPQIAANVEDVKLSVKDEQDTLGPVLQAKNDTATSTILIMSIVILILGILFAMYLANSITNPINQIIEGLTANSEQVGAAAGQVSSTSQSLSEGASEQASGLEETSSSLEEMASMAKQNAEGSQKASVLANEAAESTAKGTKAMEEMIEAIGSIKQSSDETVKIIKVIDEIAFQTNLLALNAAVEAARAGEAGKGFAVVAEEVRNLAQRSAEAAKNTNDLIEGSQKNADNGVQVSQDVANMLEEISKSTNSVTTLITEITAASQEQAQGVDQLNTAVSQMDQITQSNAANAEETASSSEELSAQAVQLQEVVDDLTRMVKGTSGGSNHTAAAKPQTQTKTKLIQHSTTPAHASVNMVKSNGSAKKAAAAELIPLNDDDFSDF